MKRWAYTRWHAIGRLGRVMAGLLIASTVLEIVGGGWSGVLEALSTLVLAYFFIETMYWRELFWRSESLTSLGSAVARTCHEAQAESEDRVTIQMLDEKNWVIRAGW